MHDTPPVPPSDYRPSMPNLDARIDGWVALQRRNRAIREHLAGEHNEDADVDCPTCREELSELGMGALLP